MLESPVYIKASVHHLVSHKTCHSVINRRKVDKQRITTHREDKINNETFQVCEHLQYSSVEMDIICQFHFTKMSHRNLML